ncbi:MAG: PilZ domain-containing protein [Pseudobdellovibrionaceae bacterium]|nr:MAG: PilZ domain-containing protein [Pseudobdellovibrionaceae bacterium]
MQDKFNNVIELRKYKKSQDKGREQGGVKPGAPVLDMTERRQQIIDDERREVKRTILTGFIGAFVVVPNQGLVKVAIYDISENGIAFDMVSSAGQFKSGEEVAMRVYLSHNTYFPFVVKVKNIREVLDEGVVRHGSGFVGGTVNDMALEHFVKFIENVSASLERDSGDVMVSNLSR